jgi:regulator of sigma E protease
VSVFVAILGLALLIFIHELGHFVASLAVGMRPRGFSIGFGPPLVKVRRHGIDYALRVIPLGGYVTIPGMTRPQPSDVDVQLGAAVHDAPQLVGPAERLKRSLATGDTERARTDLEEFAETPGAADARGVDRGLQNLRDGLSDDAYWRQATWRRIVGIGAGPVTNLLFAVVLFAVVLAVAGGKGTTTVDYVNDGTPAQRAGLQPGDRIIAINGQPTTPSSLTGQITGSEGRPLMLVVRRGRETVVLGPVRPQKDEGVYRLGFGRVAEPLGLGEAVWESVTLTVRLTREIGASLGNIVHKEGRDQIASPIGIVDESHKAVEQGWEQYVALLAFISLSLGLLNLLPLLPLDGGHIVFALLEKARGNAIRREIYERVSVIGIALVLLLFFVGLSNDVNRFGGG